MLDYRSNSEDFNKKSKLKYSIADLRMNLIKSFNIPTMISKSH